MTFSGLVFSRTLTLYITPIYYVYLDRLQQGLGNIFGKKKTAKEVATEHDRELEPAR